MTAISSSLLTGFFTTSVSWNPCGSASRPYPLTKAKGVFLCVSFAATSTTDRPERFKSRRATSQSTRSTSAFAFSSVPAVPTISHPRCRQCRFQFHRNEGLIFHDDDALAFQARSRIRHPSPALPFRGRQSIRVHLIGQRQGNLTRDASNVVSDRRFAPVAAQSPLDQRTAEPALTRGADFRSIAFFPYQKQPPLIVRPHLPTH